MKYSHYIKGDKNNCKLRVFTLEKRTEGLNSTHLTLYLSEAAPVSYIPVSCRTFVQSAYGNGHHQQVDNSERLHEWCEDPGSSIVPEIAPDMHDNA